jgi:thymidylate synthase (FAD)
MKIISPSFEILSPLGHINGDFILNAIEQAGRTCYKSKSSMNRETSQVFVKNLIERSHESVLEHQSVTVLIVCDRGVSHEIVRHRLASYSQESTRYCNYAKKNEVTFIEPCFWDKEDFLYLQWKNAMREAECTYLVLINNGASPQEARSVLPNSLKTEIVVTMNLREWRHFFKLRAAGTAGKPHPQMLEITVPMLAEFKKNIPVVFDDIEPIKQ